MANPLEEMHRAKVGRPNAPITGVVGSGERSGKAARQERKHQKALVKAKAAKREEEIQHREKLIELGRNFNQVGLSWRGYLSDDDSGKAKVAKKQWQELLPQFTGANDNERLSLLQSFSTGLGLSEDRPEPLMPFYKYPLETYQQMTDGKRFSTASMYLIEVVGDISGLNVNQKSAFRNSINTRNDTRGRVRLEQTFPGIAHLMVRQSERIAQSSRLS